MSKTSKTLSMVQLALFCAIIVVLSSTALGYIPLGAIRATTIHIPVIIGGIVLGPRAGAFLGGVFGLTSFINNTINPVITSFVFTPFYDLGDFNGGFMSIVICFVPRILIGITAAYAYRGLIKLKAPTCLSAAIAGFIGSITNTVLVMSGIYFFFGESYALAREMPITELLGLILSVITVNGVIEAIVATIIATSVALPLLKITKNKLVNSVS